MHMPAIVAQPEHKKLIGLAAFFPQLLLLLKFTIYHHDDLPFCVTAITVVFVVFQKVCTVQYFVWYFCLLPLMLPQSTMPLRRGGQLCMIWLLGQGFWLFAAFLLEMQGGNTFIYIW
jgi:GPI mannosyltransferase 1 subunit M